MFLKYLVKKRAISVCMTGKFFSPPLPPPGRQHLWEKFFRYPFQYPKVLLEVGAPPPQSFDASYAPG